jgi:WD40 repeat protein/DNA-binding SARP family transcriptional activator
LAVVMEFRILGPLEVRGPDGPIELGGEKPRVVLAVLLLHPNQRVSTDRIATALWGDNVPGGPQRAVQVHVSRLRKTLGDPDRIRTSGAGYSIYVRPGELDFGHFSVLLEEGRSELSGGRPEQAAAVLREALSLWRGPPLDELQFDPGAEVDLTRLDEHRLTALELRIDADLASGRHGELVAELQQLVRAHPTRERLTAQLMLAMYRAGRQAEALDAYHETRRVLVDEYGVEPGPELSGMQAAVLRHDESLDFQPPPADLPPELDPAFAPPLVGRDGELASLLRAWEGARSGDGAFAVLTGPHGIGKTRLAAEVAREVHRQGAVVLYAAGNGPPEAAVASVRRARHSTRPTLLLVDDADTTTTDVIAEIDQLVDGLPTVPVLLLVTAADADDIALAGSGGTASLAPLDTESVRAIALLYARGQAAADVPADWLRDASGGVPSQVHALAQQWARREAARRHQEAEHRVGAVAGRAAAGRAELRSIEADLAGGIAELQATGESVEVVPGDAAATVCPFKGLASFEAVDAGYFFGRERLVAELVARLVGAPLLGVVGPSGSGKSSVVQAGLLPALADGVLPGSQEWRQLLMRPGEHPLRELRDVTAGVDAGRRYVLLVDQFDETFTACRDERERGAFISTLAGLLRETDGQYTVVLVIRSDHYGRCAGYPALSALLTSNQVLVGSMGHDELRAAIERPAERAGLRVDPDLTDALVGDVENEPGALPLLSTALLELWRHRAGRRLRYADYVRTGGVRGAVARLAEATFAEFDAEQQLIARRVLLRLAEEDAHGVIERRRVTLAEIDGDRDRDVADVISLLARRRLLTLSEGNVEVAHEALLREWPRLRAWLEEDAEGRRLHRRLRYAASAWDEGGRSPGDLYSGQRLSAAREWAREHEPDLNALEHEFLVGSVQREDAARKRRRTRARLLVAALAAGLALVSVAAAIALVQRERVTEQRDVALSRQLAVNANAALTTNSALSLQLALRAYGVSPTPEAEAALRQATSDFRAGAAARRHDQALSVAAAPDGRRLASTGADGTVIVWGWPDFRPLVVAKGPPSRLWGLAFSPDGRLLATGGGDGAVRVGSTDDPVATARVIGRSSRPVHAIAFGPDGSVASASEDGSVVRWPLEGGASTVYDARGGPRMYAVAFSPNGRLLAAGGEDGKVRIWTTTDGSPRGVLSTAGALVYQLAFSPDGNRLAAATDDGRTRIWSLQGETAPVILRGDPEPAITVAFSPGSDRVAVAGASGTVRVWTVHGELLREMTGQQGRTQSVAWLRDGRHIVSGGADGTTWVWEPGLPAVLRADASPVYGVALSPDGDIATGSGNGAVRWWDAATRRSSTIARLPSPVIGVDVSPDGKRVAVAADDGTVLLADKSGRTETIAREHRSVYRATFSDDGRRLATAGEGGTVRVYSLRLRGKPRIIARHGTDAATAVFSPDSAAVASTGADGMVRVTDVATGKSRVFEAEGLYNIAFSADGQRLIGATGDGGVVIWTRSGRPLLTLPGHAGAAVEAALTRDGTLVSAGADGTLRAWSPAAREAVGLGATSVLLGVQAKGINDLDVDASGRIATAGNDGSAMVWRCDVCGAAESVLQEARRRATPPLSPAEQRVLRQGAE